MPGELPARTTKNRLSWPSRCTLKITRIKCAANEWEAERMLCGHRLTSLTVARCGPGGLRWCLIFRAAERTFPPVCGLVQPGLRPGAQIWPKWMMMWSPVTASLRTHFWGTYGSGGVHSFPVTSVVKPTQMIVLGDTMWSGPGISSGFVARDPAWMGFWHTRRCNYGFWDGHLETLRAISTIQENEGDCMWGHVFISHAVHLQSRASARPEYK